MTAVKVTVGCEISRNTKLIIGIISTNVITTKERRRTDVLSDTSNQKSSTRSEVRIRIKLLTREEVVTGEHRIRKLSCQKISQREKKAKEKSSASRTIIIRKIRIDSEVVHQAKVVISVNAMDAGATSMARLPQKSLTRNLKSIGSRVVMLTSVSTN